MLAVEPSASDMLRLLPLAHGSVCGASSFHHSDSLAFNLSEASIDFDPDYDEATIPVNTVVKPEPTATSEPRESSIAARINYYQDLSSSWPCNKNRGRAPGQNNKKKKKKQQRRRSMLSRSPSFNKTSKVRFSPSVEVRTHSIVLGDHPFCEDGLAVELGWDYEDSKDICSTCGVEHKPPRWRRLLPNYPYPKRERSSSQPRHLSEVERKKLLLEVGGCSETEVRLRQFQVRLLLQVHQLQVGVRRASRPRSSGNTKNKKKDSIPVARQGSPSKPLYAAMA